jgi:ABC transporter DrrB family efflux protein
MAGAPWRVFAASCAVATRSSWPAHPAPPDSAAKDRVLDADRSRSPGPVAEWRRELNRHRIKWTFSWETDVWAMVVKEFRQLRRDRRTLAMMIILPVLLLVVFGYAANFNVKKISTVVVGPRARLVAPMLHAPFHVVELDPRASAATATERLRDGDAVVAIVTGAHGVLVLMDGTQLFPVETARGSLAQLAGSMPAGPPGTAGYRVQILYNPGLSTSWVMVPGLAGLILVFIGTLITSLGVVRERQTGTLEQLAVMPLRPWDVIVGKIAPYLFVAALDLAIIVTVGLGLFHVPFVGNVATFVLGAGLFLLVTLGMGILISTVSQNQGQAIQLAFMVMLPQVLLSGLIFPVSSMAPGVRWLSYVLPLTYFNEISRGVMLKGTPIGALAEPMLLLALLAVMVLGLAILRFRRDLAPAGRRAPARRRGVARP